MLFIFCNCYSQFNAIVTPLINREYADKLLNSIKNAQKSIYVIMFQTGYYPEYPESFSNLILNELINAVKRKVKVEVVLEQGTKNSVKEKNLKTGKYLAENGVIVYFDDERKTTHAKLVVIDEKLVFIGSHNWNYYALEKNNEISVLIESSQTAQFFVNYFNKLKKSCKLFKLEKNF
ncbi:MAG: phospholipase D-like domain-containing protein [Candidatus Omnitrophica bacterium]|nr:phospholipase D-like domain-containing protein [Candidatus Omnitrophota bacterium]MCM8806788.1 phospholipase D-like domain-containing protein [Candidatus Omnitrophota bacterium]